MRALLLERQKPLICAHRCRWGNGWPNSLAGLQAALDAGAEMVEIDVRRSRDGVLYAWHDAKLPDGSVPTSLTYRDICSTFSRAQEPPALEELLSLGAGRTTFNLDLKELVVEELLALTGRYLSVEEFVLTGGDRSQIMTAKQIQDSVSPGLTLNTRLRDRTLAPRLRRAHRCGADLLAINHRLATKSFLKRAADAGLPCLVWTVNDDRGLAALLSRPGVAAIITDRPERAHHLRGLG